MITIYCGKSAAGKDFMYTRALESCTASPIVSATTRPMREGEKEGVDYYYKTKEEFLAMVEDGSIFEYRSYKTDVNGVEDVWYYGSPKVDVEKDYVVVLDLNGAFTYANFYGPENVKVVYVYADDGVRLERAKKRGSFDQSVWDARAIDDSKYTDDKLAELQAILGENFCSVNNNLDWSMPW